MHGSRTSCICGRNAGAFACRYCHRLTCTHCHHGEQHLSKCPTTREKETRRR